MSVHTSDNPIYLRRRWFSRFHLSMAWCTMAFGLFWLGWIFFTLLPVAHLGESHFQSINISSQVFVV